MNRGTHAGVSYGALGRIAERARNVGLLLTGCKTDVEARTILGSAPYAAMAMNNVVINGAMDVSQELGTTGATLTSAATKYALDGFVANYVHAAGTAVVTTAQLAAASFPVALLGFQFGHQIKATTAISSPANSDRARFLTKIEGYRVAHWGWGAAGAKDVVVAFQLYSTATGTAFVRLFNSASDRLYYHEIAVAAGWNFYSFSVPGDTSGTWLKDNGIGLNVDLFVCGKEATPQSSLDTWVSTAKVQTTNSTNLLGTNNNQTILTGVYIAAGTQLPTAEDLPKLMRPSDVELDLCQRYFEKSAPTGTNVATVSDGNLQPCVGRNSIANQETIITVSYKKPKRATPTLTVYPYTTPSNTGRLSNVGGTDLAANSATVYFNTDKQFTLYNNSGGSLTLGGSSACIFGWYADARL